jgi:hypothetical protein
MQWVKWFFAGFLAVPFGHQIALWVLQAAGFTQRAPFSMEPTLPFGVPAVISLSFWGGVWGIILGLVLTRTPGSKFWIVALSFGAVVPTLVAGLIVQPLKGQPAGGDSKAIAMGLIINGVWAVVTAALYRAMSRRVRPVSRDSRRQTGSGPS